MKIGTKSFTSLLNKKMIIIYNTNDKSFIKLYTYQSSKQYGAERQNNNKRVHFGIGKRTTNFEESEQM
jgi:hypothetical protein